MSRISPGRMMSFRRLRPHEHRNFHLSASATQSHRCRLVRKQLLEALASACRPQSAASVQVFPILAGEPPASTSGIPQK
jgi:hypothetical protein